MIKRYFITLGLVFFLVGSVFAVNTGSIDRVRDKSSLTSSDLSVIDEFVSQGVEELVNVQDFTTIARIRTTILSRRNSNQPGAQARYQARFNKAARQSISQAIDSASMINSDQRKFRVLTNLLILIDGLGNPNLATLSLDYIDSNKPVIQYWAVHSMTNSGIVKSLNENQGNEQVEGQIVNNLKGILGSCCPEITSLIVQFAGQLESQTGKDLLIKTVNYRLEKYENWNVQNPLLDATVLNTLCQRIVNTAGDQPEITRKFAQLYSYTIQQYVKGQDYLSQQQKNDLRSVLVEVERTCIGEQLGKPQVDIKRAVERGDFTALMLQHSRLLGDQSQAGQLSRDLNFNYGQTSDGNIRTAPRELTSPPNS